MFYLSKLAELLILPSIALTLCCLIGILILRAYPRFGRSLALGSLSLLLLIGLLPVGEFVIRPLEERFAPPDRALLREAHTAVMLGGVLQPNLMPENRPLALGEAAERLVELDRISLIQADLPLVISGGSGSLWEQNAEAPLIRDWLGEGGLDKRRVMVEAESRNTFENAQKTLELLAPTLPDDREIKILIITSASHMPRSIGVFRRVAANKGLTNLRFTAWPVDYRSSPLTVLRLQRFGQGLAKIDHAAREWVALTLYFLLGRTDQWLPRADVTISETPT